MNSVALTLYVSLVKIVQVKSMIYDKKENIFEKYIVCGETRTYDLNLDSCTLYPMG